MDRRAPFAAALLALFVVAAPAQAQWGRRAASCPGGSCPYAAPAPAQAPPVRYVYAAPQPAPAPAVRYYATTTTTTTTTAASGLAEINAYRARYGLPPIAFDPSCDGLAATNNACQARRGLGHFVGGVQCAAVGTAHAAGAVAMWVASAPHRAILLSRSITRGACRVENGCATFQAR